MDNIKLLENLLFFFAVFSSFVWLIIKITCKNKGYPISLFVNHQWDIKNMIDIIKREESFSSKSVYIIMLLLLGVSLCGFFIFAFQFLIFS